MEEAMAGIGFIVFALWCLAWRIMFPVLGLLWLMGWLA